ncbi:DUF1549 domain-containing protein [Tuwongella immobilis]|uniref:DUF1549 domain-containing protein n=1 Tax=Tuwongella immobilis TaxID=692036 RepID=A0A6C2YPP1_9BACT|nr:DUF1549 domain-containing protein [Tuwongella immobilis]VIP03426.1 Uncharacterized protein OS=Pirellula staleyi (strain ATCC 27377 / DSM 6068 / ICPB 4128) GN=Psta_1604 PE=4 SV=1: PSCyt2: PSD1 [Tuwongella immobilis]VTS04224.1 Uncharacterized protein OS=Pirellula staleyi (strain ATCC 27377 / DSM 6068 / ICPB 4128) GN=Psta_1604 PE=4 SV=1: PSCyt2: PSD1 [Tuwongella immobilis]
MRSSLALVLLVLSGSIAFADSLSEQIDRIIRQQAGMVPISPPADDDEFLRRVTLDFAGRIPTEREIRAFRADRDPNKRPRTIDALTQGPEYAKQMASWMHQMWMERLGDHPAWQLYLQQAFATNRPWRTMAAEMLRGQSSNATDVGAVFFLAKRLENYGQVPVDHSALTRDIGRLFLGVDLRCAECHDHLTIPDYKQDDFVGLAAFTRNAALLDAKQPSIREKPLTEKLEFASVFTKVRKQSGPRIPGRSELTIPAQPKGSEFRIPPDAKAKTPGTLRFSPLEQLSVEITAADHRQFARNFVNRLWFALLGHGLVHPLDLHHRGNPPSHPQVLERLTDAFLASGTDIRELARIIARTDAYQRSSILPNGITQAAPEDRFVTALEKRLSAEQLFASVLRATGEWDRFHTPEMATERTALLARFQKAFANQPREPEESPEPSLRAALFLSNDPKFLDLLTPRPGNLVARLAAIAPESPAELAELAFLNVLSRSPDSQEQALVRQSLPSGPADVRLKAIQRLVWSLLTSTEFSVNH